jgi:predicted GIY-YIG superfamily endonuclease
MRERPEKIFHVYIMASKPRGVLYVGMSSDLAGRGWKHCEHVLEGFTKRYWVDRWSISSVTTKRMSRPGASAP